MSVFQAVSLTSLSSVASTLFHRFPITLVYFLHNSWYTKTSLFVCLLVYYLCPLLDSPSPTRLYCFWGQAPFSLLLSNVSNMHNAYHIICAQWSICWMNGPIQWNSFMWVSPFPSFCCWNRILWTWDTKVKFYGWTSWYFYFPDRKVYIALYLPLCGQLYSLVHMCQSTNICWAFSVCWVTPWKCPGKFWAWKNSIHKTLIFWEID